MLGELMLQLNKTKQIKLYLNNSTYNKLKVSKTKIKHLRMWHQIEYRSTGTCPASEYGSPGATPSE